MKPRCGSRGFILSTAAASVKGSSSPALTLCFLQAFAMSSRLHIHTPQGCWLCNPLESVLFVKLYSIER